MTVTFYSGFSKRRNSTKQPSGGTGKTVVLKENTSLQKPGFLVSTVDWSWNYCQAFGQYYYIVDIVSEGQNLFRVECELDPMATFKTQIGAYSTLISRSSADDNYEVVDNIYPAKAQPNTKRSSVSNPGLFTLTQSAGCYVIGTIGNKGQHVYVMNQTYFDLFCYRLFPILGSDTDYTDFLRAEVSQAAAGGLSNILNNVTFLRWIPINYSNISGLLTHTAHVYIGNWDLVTPAEELVGSTVVSVLGTSLSFAARDDSGTRGRWLYLAPFANYSVYIPPFGLITLDASYVVASGREVYADIMANVMTGNLTLRLYYSLGAHGVKMAGIYNANVSSDMKVGGASYNMIGTAAGLGAAVAAYAAENYVAAVGAIASAAASSVPQTAQVGGGVSGPTPVLAESWYTYASYYDPIEENNAELGRPLAKVKTISSIAGFVQCANASLAIPGHEEEMIKVNSMLNSGFFYE